MTKNNNRFYNETTVNALIAFCDEYCNVFDTFVKNIKSQKLKLPQQVIAADMLTRSRITVEALGRLFPLLLGHPNHKMNVFLLLRSQISDIFTYLCILTFEDTEDPKEIALSNESDLLDVDFFKAMLALHEENKRLLTIGGITKVVSSSDEDRNNAIKEELYQKYEHLLSSNKKPKSVQEIRVTTGSKHFTNDSEKRKNGLSNEKDKFERIMLYSSPSTKEQIAPLYSIFKYYSQFQHYSRGSMFFFKHKHLDHDIFGILIVVTTIYTVCELQYRRLLDGPNEYSESLKVLDNILEKIINQ